MCHISGNKGQLRGTAKLYWVEGVGVGRVLEEIPLSLCHRAGGWCFHRDWGGIRWGERVDVVLNWSIGGEKRPERLTGDRRQYR